jgi:dipeptidyl aminopeptidase/acylaminoacyl peptidase
MALKNFDEFIVSVKLIKCIFEADYVLLDQELYKGKISMNISTRIKSIYFTRVLPRLDQPIFIGVCTSLLLSLTSVDAAYAQSPSAIKLSKSSKPLHTFVEIAFSPNKHLLVSVEGDSSASGGAPIIRELLIRDIEKKTSKHIQLPCGKVAQCWPESPAWTPDSAKISFALRTPGSHARSIYQVNADGSNLKKLLSFNGTISNLMYSPAGQLAMLATENATKELGAVEAAAPSTGDMNAATPEQRIAVLKNNQLQWESPAELFVYEYDWIPDGSGFVGTAAEGDGDSNWWVAKLYHFSKAQGKVLYTPANQREQLAAPTVSRDGKQLAFIVGIMSDFGSTGGDLFTMPMAGGTALNVTPKLPASVTDVEWDCKGNLLAQVLAGDQTQLVNFGSGSKVDAGKVLWSGQESLTLDRTKHSDVCTSNQRALLHQSFTIAPEIAVGDIGQWHNLTQANIHMQAPFKVQSLNWKSDTFQVQGWLMMPDAEHNARQKNGKLPMITIIHGGPAAAVTPNFIGAGSRRKLLEQGYALFMPNPRGSYGQGEEFAASNVRDFGYGDLRDILAGVDTAISKAAIDGERLGIMGHSYGGFMMMWTVTQTNRFKVAVAGAGIANWQSYYGQNGIDAWLLPYFGATVYDDPQVYAKSSPINFIRQVKTPTLSVVGAADLECPAPQTQEFGHALKALGVPSTTVIYPGEGHAYRKPETLVDVEKRTMEWFAQYLK